MGKDGNICIMSSPHNNNTNKSIQQNTIRAHTVFSQYMTRILDDSSSEQYGGHTQSQTRSLHVFTWKLKIVMRFSSYTHGHFKIRKYHNFSGTITVENIKNFVCGVNENFYLPTNILTLIFTCIHIGHKKFLLVVIFLSVCPHVSTQPPLIKFPWNFILRPSWKSAEKFQIWLKWDKNIRCSTWRPECIFLLLVTFNHYTSTLFE
jgi:hypothetical protein